METLVFCAVGVLTGLPFFLLWLNVLRWIGLLETLKDQSENEGYILALLIVLLSLGAVSAELSLSCSQLIRAALLGVLSTVGLAAIGARAATNHNRKQLLAELAILLVTVAAVVGVFEVLSRFTRFGHWETWSRIALMVGGFLGLALLTALGAVLQEANRLWDALVLVVLLAASSLLLRLGLHASWLSTILGSAIGGGAAFLLTQYLLRLSKRSTPAPLPLHSQATNHIFSRSDIRRIALGVESSSLGERPPQPLSGLIDRLHDDPETLLDVGETFATKAQCEPSADHDLLSTLTQIRAGVRRLQGVLEDQSRRLWTGAIAGSLWVVGTGTVAFEIGLHPVWSCP